MSAKTIMLTLLFICLAPPLYGQETHLSCDEHPNLTDAFLEAFNEITYIELRKNDESHIQSNSPLNNPDQESIDEAIRIDNFQQHVRYLASIVWRCSKDAREYNEIVITALAIYSDDSTPHSVKEYTLQFLSSLDQEHQNMESTKAELNVLTRSTSYFSNVSIYAFLALQAVKTVILRRFMVGQTLANRVANYLMNLSRRDQVAIFVGTPIVVGSGVEAVEWLEDILDGPRFDPAVLVDYILFVEMRDLTVSACDLTEDLKQQDSYQNNQESFEGFISRHQDLNKTYEMLSNLRPGYHITQRSTPSDLIEGIESAENMDERLERLFEEGWRPVSSNHGVCNNTASISLLTTGRHLQESQQRLSQ